MKNDIHDLLFTVSAITMPLIQDWLRNDLEKSFFTADDSYKDTE